MGRGVGWGEAPKRWGGKSQTPRVLAARPLVAGQVLCAVSASPSVSPSIWDHVLVVRPAILGILASSWCGRVLLNRIHKGRRDPLATTSAAWFSLRDPSQAPSRDRPSVSQSTLFITLPPMTACIFNSTALPARTRRNLLHFVTKCQREPPHSHTCSVQCAGAHFCVQL